MPSPLWTALPASLDNLLARMIGVTSYPIPTVTGAARCEVDLLAHDAPDPHDWRPWRSGVFIAAHDGRVQQWSLLLRRCPRCRWTEVRRDEEATRVASTRRGRRPRDPKAPGRAVDVLGWYPPD